MSTSIKTRQGILLIFLCSFLLGIWATVNTIALRNILLVSTAVLSINYLSKWFKGYRDSLIGVQLLQSNPLRWLPSTLIVAMFIWVILHYLFFSQFPENQWDELTSTWLRALLGAISGFGCAIALRRNPTYAWLLWLGLITSFLVLINQYIPKAITNRSLFLVDNFGSYIYWAKYSGVLAGIVLFAGTLGLLFDSIRQLTITSDEKVKDSPRFNQAIIVLVVTLGLLLPIYSFVFIFRAKNGVGVAAILLIFWFMVLGICFMIQLLKDYRSEQSGRKWIRLMAFYFIFLMMFSWFAYIHAKNNPGWESLIDDIRISSQIETYQNWKSPSIYGYPKRADGSSVTPNTYDRVSLATVGLKLIIDHPFGNGVFRSLPSQMRQSGIEYDNYTYTHSGWVDLGLSFGLPGMLLIPIALFLCLTACIKKYYGTFRATVASMAISFLVLYFVGEYAFQHGIETLLFISALLAGLILPDQKPIPDRYLI